MGGGETKKSEPTLVAFFCSKKRARKFMEEYNKQPTLIRRRCVITDLRTGVRTYLQ